MTHVSLAMPNLYDCVLAPDELVLMVGVVIPPLPDRLDPAATDVVGLIVLDRGHQLVRVVVPGGQLDLSARVGKDAAGHLALESGMHHLEYQ